MRGPLTYGVPMADGQPLVLSAGTSTATVDPTGAAVQSLRVDGRQVVVGYPPGPDRTGFFGALLLPWPNRLGDGTYVFDGLTHRAAVNEPERGTALHGLVVWTRFAVVDRAADHVRLSAVVPVQPAYPTTLRVEVRLTLAEGRLDTVVDAVNTGDRPGPYGVGVHPYLTCGVGAVDDWTLRLPGDTVVEVDDRLLPTGRLLDAAAEGLDFRRPTPLRGTVLDRCFHVDDTGGDSPSVELRHPDGHGVALHAPGGWARWFQVFTADALAPPTRRAAVAVEPMSCPPDALRTGTDLLILQPGDTHTARWTVEALW